MLLGGASVTAPLMLPVVDAASVIGAAAVLMGTMAEVLATGTAPTTAAALASAVTIKYQGADLASGAYTLTGLPTAAPRYAVYSAALPLQFNTAAAVLPGAGKYTVQASATGYTTVSAPPIDISAANQANVNFTLKP